MAGKRGLKGGVSRFQVALKYEDYYFAIINQYTSLLYYQPSSLTINQVNLNPPVLPQKNPSGSTLLCTPCNFP
jgi:hypothetical protein